MQFFFQDFLLERNLSLVLWYGSSIEYQTCFWSNSNCFSIMSCFNWNCSCSREWAVRVAGCVSDSCFGRATVDGSAACTLMGVDDYMQRLCRQAAHQCVNVLVEDWEIHWWAFWRRPEISFRIHGECSSFHCIEWEVLRMKAFNRSFPCWSYFDYLSSAYRNRWGQFSSVFRTSAVLDRVSPPFVLSRDRAYNRD